jgi:hypothetical protein
MVGRGEVESPMRFPREIELVGPAGVEPAWSLRPRGLKPLAYSNSATDPQFNYILSF